MKTTRFSNCLFEAVRAKIRYGKRVKIIHIKPKDNDANCHHWMWHDPKENTVCDWYQEYALKHWWDWVLHKGYIRVRPYSAYERWLKQKDSK